jgi:hypothetical protein
MVIQHFGMIYPGSLNICAICNAGPVSKQNVQNNQLSLMGVSVNQILKK